MKKVLYFFSILFFACSLTGCGSSISESEQFFFGRQEAYNVDFLWSKYIPDTLTRTLCFEKEGEAFTRPIKFGLFETINDPETGEEKEQCVGNEIELYINGKLQPRKEFVVYPKDKELTIGVVFNRDIAEERDYYWNLKVIDAGDLNMINDNLITQNIPLVFTWKANYDTRLNPLLLGLIWLCIIIAALLVLWFALLRWIIFPSFAFDNLQVTYFEGESRKGREDCTLHGARRIICSKSPKYQSGLNKLFCGRIEYLTNPFWETTVVMTPCGSDGITVNEDLKAGDAATYRMTAMITAQNGPRRPFVVKRTKSEMVANISIA